MELPKDRRLSHVSRTTAVMAPSERVFAVLEDPALLADLLPAALQVSLQAGPWMMREGARIDYRMTLRGVTLHWPLEVSVYLRGESFVQRLVDGPLEHFEHRVLVQAGEESSRVVDLVSWRSHYGFLGRLFDRFVLRSEIDSALAHRHARLKQMLES